MTNINTSQSNPWKSNTNRANEKAFASIREDGSVVAWGNRWVQDGSTRKAKAADYTGAAGDTSLVDAEVANSNVIHKLTQKQIKPICFYRC